MQNVTIKPFKIIGITIRTTNENNQSTKDISELWNKFMTAGILDQIPNKTDNTIYSLYTDYEGDHTKPYTTILGCKVENLNEIPEGMTGRTFDGGTYIKTSAKGDLMKGLVANHWAEIWGMNLDRVFTADYEMYGEKTQNPTNAEVDFYVAVK